MNREKVCVCERERERAREKERQTDRQRKCTSFLVVAFARTLKADVFQSMKKWISSHV